MAVGIKILEIVDERVNALESSIQEWRRYLHRHPEPSGEEYKTATWIAHVLEDYGLHYRLAPSGRGVIVDSLDQQAPRRAALRADIDALRIQDEKEEVIYRSRENNLMHACGHDAHTAMLMGAVIALHQVRGAFNDPPTWRAIFQPAEESATGAREMMAAGALKEVDSIVALHVDPTLQAGQVGWRSGALTARCEEFSIYVKGRGGHGARPHQTVDALMAATQLVQQAYVNIPHCWDARDPLVVSFGMLQAGYNPNVIPDKAELRGTIRSINESASNYAYESLQAIAKGLETTLGVSIHLERASVLPAVYNDPAVTTVCRAAAKNVLGPDQVVPIQLPSMGGEDFAYYLEEVPGCMLRLGVGFGDGKTRYLHSPHFDLEERALPLGSRILARAALRLSQPVD